MKHSFKSLWFRLATPPPRDQRGIALLLTLGVLSLLLVLAMSFAYSSRTERMAAGNNADLIKARLLAESGMERAMAALRLASTATSSPIPISTEETLYPGNNAKFFYSATSGNWAGRHYMYSVNGADQSGIAAGLAVDFTPTSGSALTFTPSDNTLPNSGWIDIFDSSSTSASPPIIGRVSYVVIDQGGMIDPNAVVSTGTNETTVVPRTGADPTEIQLDNLATPANGMANGFLTNTPTGMRWFSMAHIANKNTGSQAQFDIFRQALFPWSYDTDKYRLTPTSSDERSRYNLASTGTNFVELSSTDTANPIPWLTTLTDSGGNSVVNQVAANLIDYCDSDSIATAGPNFPSNVTYVGLERVPYINRVEVDAVLSSSGTDTVLQVTTRCELVNIYTSTGAPSPNLEVKIEFDKTDWPNAMGPFAYTWNGAVGSNSYIKPDWTYSSTAPGVHNPAINIKNISITESDSAAFADPTHLWDFASIMPASVSKTDFSTASIQSFVIQAKDPRCNTNSGDWTWSNSGAWYNLAASMGHPNPSTGSDLETSSDVVSGVSTAYIANTSMKSLWELGAIHRGEPWRTMNLSKYNTTSTATNGTGGKYDDGDANILDQVTLSTTTTGTAPIRGRFNANSPQTEAWACFLAGVRVGDTGYDQPGTGTLLNNADGNAIAAGANGIFAINGADATVSGNVPLTNRGGIAKWVGGTTRTTLSNNTVPAAGSQVTDRAREEIIGKIAGLLTVRSNYFTVIVTAQAVKDTGTVDAKTSNTVQYASSPAKYCQVLAEQKILAVVSRDAFTDKFVIESFEYLDE